MRTYRHTLEALREGLETMFQGAVVESKDFNGAHIFTTEIGVLNWFPATGEVRIHSPRDTIYKFAQQVDSVLEQINKDPKAKVLGCLPEYWVVQESDNRAFSQQCTQMLQKGWTMHGHMRSNSIAGSVKLLQAFVRNINVS